MVQFGNMNGVTTLDYVDYDLYSTLSQSAPGHIHNFTIDFKSIKGRIYSWNDNFGCHQHFVDL